VEIPNQAVSSSKIVVEESMLKVHGCASNGHGILPRIFTLSEAPEELNPLETSNVVDQAKMVERQFKILENVSGKGCSFAKNRIWQ
jgi:hypothetical protein